MTTFREILQQIGNLFRWWYVVAPWEQSVRVRLGKRVAVLDAGVHLRIPMVDVVYRQSIRRRFATLATMTLTTQDGKVVTVSGEMAYAIADIGTLYNTLHDAEDTINGEARGAIAQYVTTHSIEDCAPAKLATAVTKTMDLSRYGLADVEFFITDFAVVRTYRLIQGGPKDWKHGLALDTARPDGPTQ